MCFISPGNFERKSKLTIMKSKKIATLRLCTSLFLFAILVQADPVVTWEPATFTAGDTIRIFYNLEAGTLPNSTAPVYIHIGYNDWQDVVDLAMSIEESQIWGVDFAIPNDAEVVDFVFTDLAGNWDNNGGIGIDWHISLLYNWYPLTPNPNDSLTIFIHNSAPNPTVQWQVSDGMGYSAPFDDYHPANTTISEDGFWASTPAILNGEIGEYRLQFPPMKNPQQLVQALKFRVFWEDGATDETIYDIYADFTQQENDVSIQIISPGNGSEITGTNTVLVNAPDATSIEVWAGLDFVGIASGGFLSQSWTPSDLNWGPMNLNAVATSENGRVSVAVHSISVIPQIEYEPAPVGISEGVTVNGSEVSIALFAPAKDFVAILGSWNSEFPNGELMKLSGDTLWWYETQLSEGEYFYQFNLENEKRIADPFSQDVEWKSPDGQWESSYFEDAKTVFQVGATEFQWTDGNYQTPEEQDFIIYECHIGDFLGIDGEIGTYTHLLEKLDEGYFDDLGITAIELMPIMEFEGENSWGYNTSFLMAPESTYGTPDELKILIDQFHAHGIAVLLDVVYNHTWGSSPLFQLYQPKDNWDFEDHDYTHCPYYQNAESEWGYKLDHWKPRTKRIIRETLRLWVEDYHIDGFRFDYAPGVGWDGYNANGMSYYSWFLNELAPETFVIIEEDNSYQVNTTETDAGWDYSYYHNSFAQIQKTNHAGHSWGDMSDVAAHIHFSGQGYNDHWGPVNYIVSHDEPRIIEEATQYQGMSESEAIARSLLGATMLFTGTGVPMIYHGQEFGQAGDSHQGNGIIPNPLSWDNLDNPAFASLWEDYRSLIHLRRNNSAFTSANLNTAYQSNVEKCIVYWRWEGEEHAVVVLNFDDNSHWITVPFNGEGQWFELFSGNSISVSGGEYGMEIPASGALVFTQTAADEFPPNLVSVDYLNPQTLQVNFSESVEENSAENIGNYMISGVSCEITDANRSANNSQVYLTILPNLEAGQSGTITAENIIDEAGNLIDSENNSANFTVPEENEECAFHTIQIDGINDFYPNSEFFENISENELSITWDENYLYVGFTELDLNGGGDLFVNIDTNQESGVGASSGSWGRVNFSGDFMPEYQVAIEGGGGSMQVNRWFSSTWVYPGNGEIGNSYEGWETVPFTEISIPWQNIGNPDGVAISVHISAEDSWEVPQIFPLSNDAGNHPTIMDCYAFFEPNITSSMPVDNFPPNSILDEQTGEKGDLNGDGALNVLDIVRLVNIILGDSPTEYESWSGDLNDDGALNVLDIVQLVNLILSS